MSNKVLLFFILYSLHLAAQNPIDLQFKLIDTDTKSGIELATIYIPESKHYCETNSKGECTLSFIPQKWNSFSFQRLGYEKKQIKLTLEELLSKSLIEIELKAKIEEEVIIKESKEDQSQGIREKAEQFQLLPTISGNIESVLPSIALGVRASAGGELSSQYSVRGGNYDENLVFVNDFEIFRPQLIRNGQQEGLSFPNSDLIRDLIFSSGAFDSKYGDKMSSVLDIKYKIPQQYRGSFQLSALGASAHLEGAMSGKRNLQIKKFKYLIGARYKTNQYLLNSLDVQGEYSPSFIDIQSYLSYDITPSLQLGWIGNWNKSIFKFIPESSTVGKGSVFFTLKLNTYYEGEEKDYFDQQMTGLSLSYYPQRKINPYYFKLLSSIHSGFEAEQFDILGYYRLVEVEAGDKQDDPEKEVRLWGEGTQHTYTRNYLKSAIATQDFRFGIDLNQGNRWKHFIQAGLSYRNEQFDDAINEWERIDSAGFSLPHGSGQVLLNYVLKSKNQIKNQKLVFWAQDAMQTSLNSKLKLKWTWGFRSHFSTLNNELYIGPRTRIEFIPLQSYRNQIFYLSTGIYSQMPFYREMRDLNGQIHPEQLSQKSYHIVAGTKMDFKWQKVSNSAFRWISEVYYKKIWDGVSYDLDNVRIRYSGLNDINAFVIGWDNRVNGEFVKGAESWVNLSILRSFEQIEGIQHKRHSSDSLVSYQSVNYVPRPTDQLISLGIFFQDYLHRNENFKMHFNTTIATGLPYGFKGENREYRNEYRHKPYHRIDIGFSYKLWSKELLEQKPKHLLRFAQSSWLSLEVYNLLKIKNEASVSWVKSVYNYQFAIPNYLSSRRINLKFRIDF